jgi:hypothetical protein
MTQRPEPTTPLCMSVIAGEGASGVGLYDCS